MLNKKLAIAMGIVGLLALSGCGSSSTPAQPKQDASSSQAPAAQAAQPASATASVAGDANKGKEIFTNSCSGCHSTGSDQIVGPGLKGETAKTQLANGKPMNDADLTAWIKAGGTGKIGNMPGQGGTLNDQQIADVVAYLKTLK